jgi:hypothetical protein
MKRLFALAFCAATAVAAVSAHPTKPQTTLACYPPDSNTTREVALVKWVVTSNDSVVVVVRQRAHLPAVADTAVSAVTDSTTCARALTAFNGAMDGGPYSQIYLIRAGIAFVASYPPDTTLEFNPHLMMDSSFSVVGSILR